MVSSLGVMGGFLGPLFMGWIKTRTGSFDVGISCICVLTIIGSVAVMVGMHPPLHRKYRESSD
jgi:ACS family phthalate transporter-like MFS transporter